MTMQNPQARQFRQRPRPTHMWDPERGVVPIDPNSPARFIPPPPPEVIQAYMQGMARRQGVARDLGDPAAFPHTQPIPIPNARSFGRIDPRTGAQGLMGVMPGMDNQPHRWLPAPENLPIPIPTTGWQDPRFRGPRGQGRY